MTDPEVTDVIAELDRRVRTDDLTQLGSKAQMVEWLETAASGSKLALLDLDDFRLLNQTLGHGATPVDVASVTIFRTHSVSWITGTSVDDLLFPASLL